MGRLKRSSVAVDRAEKRAAGLTAIAGDLDLGNGLTLYTYRGAITAPAAVEDYNSGLASCDSLLSLVEEQENKLDALTTRMLAGVAAKYGKDSKKYEQAGGTRSSERKTPTRLKDKVPTPA